MSEERKPLWPWIVAVLVGLPVLYVLSSGPMQTVAFRRYTAHAVGGSRIGHSLTATKRGDWWPKVYAPLLWAADQSWGKPVKWYWRKFPIREVGKLP